MSISGNSPGRSVKTAGFILLLLFLSAGRVCSQNPFYSGDTSPPSAPAEGSGGAGSSVFVDLQMTFREQAAQRLQSLRDDPSVSVLLGFAAAAFVYGVLHGAGPGHRKTVVFSLFLSRRARWYEPAAAGFLSAGVHAGTSILLILLFSLIGGRSVARDTDQAGVYLQGITLLVLAFFALALIVFHLITSARHKTREASVPAAGKGVYGLLIVTSLIPCPGVTMLLLFALSLQLPLFGVLGVLSMSLGMGVVISFAGYLAYAGREGLFQRLKDRQELLRKVSDGLEIASYLFIFLFSLYMARPFIADLIG